MITDPKIVSSVPPGRQLGHDTQTPSAEECKIYHSIPLLSKSRQHSFRAYTKVASNWTAELDSDDLTNEGEKDDMVGKECEIKPAFPIAGIVEITGGRGYRV